MYITLKELRERLETVSRNYGIETEGEVITDAWIAGPNDREYPPGTIIFQCQSNNIKQTMTPNDVHVLSIYPTQVTRLN